MRTLSRRRWQTSTWRPEEEAQSSHRAGQERVGANDPHIPDEGRLHLVSVLDVISRGVLGLALAARHDAQMVYCALAMALAVRGGQALEVILHIDCGSKYTAGIPGSLPAVRRAAVHARARIRAG